MFRGVLQISLSMRKRSAVETMVLFGVLCLIGPALSQSPLPSFTLHSPQDGLSIQREAIPSRPFSVVGPRGAVLGQQDGSFELWLFPWRILSNLRISVQMDNYPVPIDVNLHTAWIEVRPESTVITFSHANFTIREVILAPRTRSKPVGAMVLYQMEAVRPMTVTFSFTPNMQRIWPAESDDHPSPEWVGTDASNGFYLLHLNFPDHAAAVAMPTAKPGILQPYAGTCCISPSAVRSPLRSRARCAHSVSFACCGWRYKCHINQRSAGGTAQFNQ